jgi:hypothetical protein
MHLFVPQRVIEHFTTSFPNTIQLLQNSIYFSRDYRNSFIKGGKKSLAFQWIHFSFLDSWKGLRWKLINSYHFLWSWVDFFVYCLSVSPTWRTNKKNPQEIMSDIKDILLQWISRKKNLIDNFHDQNQWTYYLFIFVVNG